MPPVFRRTQANFGVRSRRAGGEAVVVNGMTESGGSPRVVLLGAVGLRQDRGTRSASAQASAVLAILALNAGSIVTTEQ